MELIKKIKQTETQAQEIIEKAKADAAGLAEKTREDQRHALEQAQPERKKAIETAVAEGQAQGLQEAEQLKGRAEGDRQQLRDKANAKKAAAVAKVMDYLKG
jgi:V/A-type H+-transporting ATPase subunit G/H